MIVFLHANHSTISLFIHSHLITIGLSFPLGIHLLRAILIPSNLVPPCLSLLALVIVLHERIFTAQLLELFLRVLLGARTGIGVGDGRLVEKVRLSWEGGVL